jgi:KaiC/GvpD/RAD55 family RecA-like ATPase
MDTEQKIRAPAEGVVPLPFGIPALDELLGYAGFGDKAKQDRQRDDSTACLTSATSLAIVGQDGTGKSVFALHLASNYLANVAYRDRAGFDLSKVRYPTVLYVSSDLSHAGAQKVWGNFGLHTPWLRYTPFLHPSERTFRRECKDDACSNAPLSIALQQLKPQGLKPTDSSGERATTQPVARFMLRGVGTQANQHRTQPTVGFVDLSRFSAGDDWLYVCRLVASASADAVANLLIVDSVEGFETLVGEKNSFGEGTSRRARVSQLMRAAAAQNWHVIFLVEEPEPGSKHPEEYVTDCVIRLRRNSKGEKVRRWIEIEKCRGREFSPGEHPFEIRSGHGTSTGEWENPDDPRTRNHPAIAQQLSQTNINAYVQVFHSLSHLSRKLAGNVLRQDHLVERRAAAREVCEFGIPHLDSLLANGMSKSHEGCAASSPNTSGLHGGSVTAVIGEGGTHKEILAQQFLLNGFGRLPKVLDECIRFAQAWSKAGGKSGPLSLALQQVDENEYKWLASVLKEKLPALPHRANSLDALAGKPLALCQAAKFEGDAKLRPYAARWDEEQYFEVRNHDTRSAGEQLDVDLTTETPMCIALAMLRVSGGLLDPAVLVTTQDVSADALAEMVMTTMEKQINEVFSRDNAVSQWYSQQQELVRWHIKKIVERHLVVRRVENIDITAPQMWHVVESCVLHALELFGREGHKRHETAPSPDSGRLRVVIGDLRLLRDMYPDVANDSLFLPVMVFRLRRLGVTALIVDTDHGRPDVATGSASMLALRSMVDKQIYTWKVSFYGEERVAIAVTPPSPEADGGLIRELKYLPSVAGASKKRFTGLDVDPHFELYSGVELGRPEPVPLKVSLWRESDQFQRYVDQENELFARLFTPKSTGEAVIEALGTKEYNAIRDYTHLPVKTRLHYTHVFAVDGYWALSKDASLQKQDRYLFSSLGGDGEIRRPDEFGLFAYTTSANDQQSAESAKPLSCRADAFRQPTSNNKGFFYRSRIPQNDQVDRVPFMWDFSFLLCNEEHWTLAADLKFVVYDRNCHSSIHCRVGDIWRLMPKLTVKVEDKVRREKIEGPQDLLNEDSQQKEAVSWRKFLAASAQVAGFVRTPAQRPFALSRRSPGSLLSLLFEIWLSEICQDINEVERFVYEQKQRKHELSEVLLQVLTRVDRWAAVAKVELAALSAEYFRGMQIGTGKQDKSPSDQNTNRLQRFLVGSGGRDSWESLEKDLPKDHDIDTQVEEAWQHLSEKGRALWRRASNCSTAHGYWRQLFRAWMLMRAAFPSLEMELDAETRFDRVADSSDEELSTSAVSVRHYYSTACTVSNKLLTASENPARDVHGKAQVPTRLPGHFCTRGDWFLAVAKGSRSPRLADMAIDILSSRRANRTRLEAGMGLPTRDLANGFALQSVRTGLCIHGKRGSLRVPYGKLLTLGGSFIARARDQGESSAASAHSTNIIADIAPFSNAPYFWLFRSGFEHFYRSEPIMRSWIIRLAAWSDSHNPVGAHDPNAAFALYDKVVSGEQNDDALNSLLESFAKRVARLACELNNVNVDREAQVTQGS